MVTGGIILVLCFFGANVAEVLWLRAKQWGTTGTATGFAAVTNLVGFGIGLFISIFAFSIVMVASLDSVQNPFMANEIVGVVLLIIGLVIPPIILFISKRIMLGLLKMRTGAAAWAFSIITALLIYVITFVPFFLLIYLVPAEKWVAP